MRGKILIALVLTIGLGGCSTFSDSKMVTMTQRDADDALKVPKYMLTAQASNVGVGEGRATDAQTSRDLADHYAKVDLCRKLVVTANSRVRTTAAQTAKGSRSNTAITGTVASETTCAALVAGPAVKDTTTVQHGYEFVTWVRLESDDVSEQRVDTFTSADSNAAQQLSAN